MEVAAAGGMSNGFHKGFMTLTFLGYYDKRRERPLERVACEVFLSKMAHKKRKESSSPMVNFYFDHVHSSTYFNLNYCNLLLQDIEFSM